MPGKHGLPSLQEHPGVFPTFLEQRASCGEPTAEFALFHGLRAEWGAQVPCRATCVQSGEAALECQKKRQPDQRPD
jgi:hypothetical protein